MKTYAAYNRNVEIRRQSSSGGIFTAFAYCVLQQGGVVYGVGMSADCYSAEYIRVDDEENLNQLRGSKYVQANLGKTFKNVKHDLSTNKIVLFSGTGCCVNGLKAFLGKEYDNLFCIDVICHGVPSPLLWRKYVKYQEGKRGKLIEVNFRSKDFGWSEYGIKENKYYISKNQDSYLQMFLRNYSLRPSCYECRAKIQKMADISLADFWGIEKTVPEMNDDAGYSLIIVRTEKGNQLFSKAQSSLLWKEVTYEDGVRHNPAEHIPPERPTEREQFYKDLQSMNFKSFQKKYTGISDLKRETKNILKIVAKKIRGNKSK